MSARILWVTDRYPPAKGGMAVSCARQVRGLRQRGLTVDVLAFGAALLERIDVLLVGRVERDRDLARQQVIAGVASANFDLVAFAAEAVDGFDEENFSCSHGFSG